MRVHTIALVIAGCSTPLQFDPEPSSVASEVDECVLTDREHVQGLRDMSEIRQTAMARCVRSSECEQGLRKYAWLQEECEAVAFVGADDAVVSSFHTDDTMEGDCGVKIIGERVTCMSESGSVLSEGCLANVLHPDSISEGNVSANFDALVANHPCHGTAQCDVKGESYRVLFTPSYGVTNVAIFDRSGYAVALQDYNFWTGPESLVGCLEVQPIPSPACDLLD